MGRNVRVKNIVRSMLHDNNSQVIDIALKSFRVKSPLCRICGWACKYKINQIF